MSETYPHAAELLAALGQTTHSLVCITNKPHGFAVDLLRAQGFGETFAHVLGGDSLPRRKPDPMPLEWVAEKLGLTTAQILLVGDSAIDIKTANAAGSPVVAVSYGYNHGCDLNEFGPALVIDSLDQLHGLLALD